MNQNNKIVALFSVLLVVGIGIVVINHFEVSTCGVDEDSIQGTINEEETEYLNFTSFVTSISDTDPMTILLESEEIRNAGYDNGIKFVVLPNTTIVNPNGGLYDIENLQKGMELRIYCKPTMTRSIPPIAQAHLVQMTGNSKDDAIQVDNSYNGTISSIQKSDDHTTIMLEGDELRADGHGKGIRYTITNNTTIEDNVGKILNPDDLEEDMEIQVFYGPVMTASYPPMGQANLIRVL